MNQVDFEYVGVIGVTIYRMCFQEITDASSQIPLAELLSLVAKTEKIFFFLVEQGIKNGYNVDSILEIPDSDGGTCFHYASLCSPDIMLYIIRRSIKVNSIKSDMLVPGFWMLDPGSDLTIELMEKGINPYVIDSDGNSQISMFPSIFESKEAKRLLATFSRSVHFSMENIDCTKSCQADCPSKFKRFYYKNGPLVEMTEENRIGCGGFGMVFRQLFHGKPMAMKCTYLGELEDPENQDRSVVMSVDYLERNISELRIQSAIKGPGVIVPVAFIRQQDQERDENGEWIALNYDIYIYPLYDCNLYELHQKNYHQFTDEILKNILSQCLTSLETLDNHNQIHQDIKPQNYLVKYSNDDKDLRNIEIVLTDFGLAGSDMKGGTPIFASPECLADGERKDKLTDIFSLGRLFLYMIIPNEQFLEFLFVPLTEGQKEKITELIEQEPILSLISKMMRIKKRLDLPAIRNKLQSVKQLMNLSGIAEMGAIIQMLTSNCVAEYIDVLKHFS